MTEMLFTDEDLKFYLYGKQHIDYNSKCSAFLSPLVPRQVCIRRSTIPGAFQGVFSKVWIRQGTEMGPYTGRMCGPKDVKDHSNTWEVFDERGDVVYFLDGGPDSHPTSWLSCVQCARSDREQNLEVTQTDRHIFYRAIKDIPPGEELLVWYGQTSMYHMGLPLTSQNTGEVERNKAPPTCQPNSADHVDKLRCVLCRRAFNSRSNLRSHMRIHTMEKPFSCKFCNKCFSQSSTLRNHVRLHTGERPYKCFVCKSSYSQLAGLRAHQRSARHKPIVATKQTAGH